MLLRSGEYELAMVGMLNVFALHYMAHNDISFVVILILGVVLVSEVDLRVHLHVNDIVDNGTELTNDQLRLPVAVQTMVHYYHFRCILLMLL